VKPLDLLSTAEGLVQSGNRKPRQSDLLRAVSTIYYAVFHTLARQNADLLIGATRAARNGNAWKQTYRALDHGVCKKNCMNSAVSAFPRDIQDFANFFVTMQKKRHSADYDPTYRTYKSEVLLDLAQAHQTITDFENAPIRDRRAFAAFVLFKHR